MKGHSNDVTIKICVVCGIEFMSVQTRQVCCSHECQVKRNVGQTKERYKRIKQEQQKKHNMKQIIELAEKEGISYGQYVAKYGI